MTDARLARQSTRVALTNPTPAGTIATRTSRASTRVGLSGAAPDTNLWRVARYQVRVLAPASVPNFAYNARSSLRVALESLEHQGIGYVARESTRVGLANPTPEPPAGENRLNRLDLRVGFGTGVTPDTRYLRVARYQLRVLASSSLVGPATVWVYDGNTWIACPVHLWNGSTFVNARAVRVWDGSTFRDIL